MKTSVPTAFAVAWTIPTRRVPRSARAHSAQPVSAVGTAATTPRPTRRVAARRMPSSGNRSRNWAIHHAPKGTSVKMMCSGMPVASP